MPVDPPPRSTPFHAGCVFVLIVFSLVGLVLGCLEALKLLYPTSSGSPISAQCVPSSASSLFSGFQNWALGIGTFFALTSRRLPVSPAYLVVAVVVLLVGYSRADTSIELQVPGGPVVAPLSSGFAPYRASSLASPDIHDFLVHESTAFMVLQGHLTPARVTWFSAAFWRLLVILQNFLASGVMMAVLIVAFQMTLLTSLPIIAR